MIFDIDELTLVQPEPASRSNIPPSHVVLQEMFMTCSGRKFAEEAR